MSYTEMEEDLHLMGSFEDETAVGEHCATQQQQHKNAAKLQAVHQAYRKMEKIKRYYHINTEGLMRRQQALLDNLKSDNDALQEMVDTYVIKDYRQQMAHLLEEANKYTGLVEAETKRLHDLEATICRLGIQELDAKKKMGGYKAGWTKHRTTQIHIQQDENRLQKANVDNNIVQGHIKLLKGKMSQLRQEQTFYTNLYQKLNKELQEWDQDIQQCIVNMNGMYSDRNEYQEEISDLLEMAGCKHNYFQWLTMEGWATQESFSLTELASSQLSGTENENMEDELKKHGLQDTSKEIAINKLRKTKDQNMRKITKTHYAKRRKAGNHYRKWVEIKAFANTQDLLKVDSISGVLPSILETQNKNTELFKHMNELLKEMDGLDLVKQDHIFGKPAPENGDSKSSVAARKYETDQTVDYLLDSLRHLEIDDEAFVPVVIDMKKQILLVFKEAGCYIKDEALGIGSDPGHEKFNKKSDNQSLELTVGKFFSKLEDFVDRISGTFS